MKKLKLLTAMVGTALALSLDGRTLAQDPQQLQNIMQQFQNMTPQQLDNMRQLSENIDPEKRQAMREQFMNMSPQQQQDALQHLSTTDPQQTLNAIQQGQDLQQMPNGIQQRAKDLLREQMGVTNDVDWSLIVVKIAAVKKARTILMSYGGGMMGMVGMLGGFGGGRDGGLQAMSGRTSPEAQALQQATDSDAPTAQTRNLLAQFRAARKEKQAALTKAQAELQSVLTMRQEAIATLGGLLD